jgi:hypothetical protein
LNKLTGETIWKSFVPDRGAGGAPQTPGPAANRPSVMQNDPVLSTLDKDRSKDISANEITAAPTALSALDKNQDGKISEDEVRPQREGGGGQRPRRGPGIMRMMKANSALDADESGTIEEVEIKNAVAALQS